MDNEDIIKKYVNQKYKGKNAKRVAGHLNLCLPFGDDFEAAKTHIASITKKNGEREYSDSYIERILKEYILFNEFRKEQLILNNNEDMIISQDAQEHSDIFSNVDTEQITQGESYNTENITNQQHQSNNEVLTQNTTTTIKENTVQSDMTQHTLSVESVEKKKAGRKVSTNRNTRFTLYMTADVLKDITALANYDNSSVTDLMNNLLVSYINERRDDIKFMEEVERRKEERNKNR